MCSCQRDRASKTSDGASDAAFDSGKRIVFQDEEGSLSNSFRFVPLSQHLSERLETDKESEREQSSTDRHLCLPAERDVFF